MLAGAQTLSILKKTQEDYNKLLNGNNVSDVIHPVNRFIYVAETDEKAVEDTKETIMSFIHRKNTVIRDFLFLPEEELTYNRLFDEVCIFGNPETCMRKIENLEKSVDLRNLVLTFNYFTIDHEKCLKLMKMFTEHLLAHLKTM